MYCPHSVTYIIKAGDTLVTIARQFYTSVESLSALNPHIDPYNLRIGSALSVCPGGEIPVPPISPMPPMCPNSDMRMQLNNQMRLAWSQHIYWTRLLLVSIAERLPDQAATSMRLLQNPADIADIFKPYYGDEAAKQIERLLTEHLQIGAMLITALRDNKTMEANELTKKWYKNADEMSKAFASLSPYYNYDELKEMFKSHLDLTTQEVSARLDKNYTMEVEAFNKVEQEAMMMADYFASGLVVS